MKVRTLVVVVLPQLCPPCSGPVRPSEFYLSSPVLPCPLSAGLSRATSLSLGMTNKPHPLLPLLLLPLLLLCSPLAVSGRGQLAKAPASFQNIADHSDYSNEEYEEVRSRGELGEMEEMEQNYENQLPSKYFLPRQKRQRRQLGERDSTEESIGETEPLLVEDPKGWGLAHILG